MRAFEMLMVFVVFCFLSATAEGRCEDMLATCPKHVGNCGHIIIRSRCQRTCNACDTNLCNVANGGCSQLCSYVNETVQCSCENGYRLADDTVTCVDINECKEGPDPCVLPIENSYCVNTPGSYSCQYIDCSRNPNGTMNYYRSGKCCTAKDGACGVTWNIKQHVQKKVEDGSRVLKGRNAVLGQWPWQAQIIYANNPLCGATLITDQWLVGAAHCFTRYPYTLMLVYLGHVRSVLGFRMESDLRIQRRISHVILHEDYNNHTSDIALIKLDRPVLFNNTITPLCLPCGEKPKIGDKCWATGFGTIESGKEVYPNILQEVDLPIVSGDDCTREYEDIHSIDTEKTMCAGYSIGGKDTCQGDSGGPLACQRSDSCDWYLAGVTSFGRGCGQAGFYGVYANVVNFESWIRRTLGNDAPKPCKKPASVCSDLTNKRDYCYSMLHHCGPYPHFMGEHCGKACCELANNEIPTCADQQEATTFCREQFPNGCDLTNLSVGLRILAQDVCPKTCNLC